MLNNLVRRNYFTYCLSPQRQYMNIILIQRISFIARSTRPIQKESLSSLSRAAGLLSEAGEIENAVGLLKEAGNWDALIGLILKHANIGGAWPQPDSI